MPRKPLDGEHETVTCTVRLPLRTRNEIDRLRKDTPRSEYIRTMIEATVGLLASPKADPAEPRKVIPTRDYSDDPGMTGRVTHRHRMIKGDEAGWVKGSKVYLYSCECGDTEVR